MSETLQAVIVGGSLTLVGVIATEIIRAIREHFAREAAGHRRRDDFQRRTLLEAQEALVEWMRATRSLPMGSRFPASDPGPFEQAELARGRISVLRERILDGEARSHLATALEIQLTLRQSSTLDETRTELERLSGQVDRCLGRMGELARALW